MFLNIFGLSRQGGHVNKILIIEDENRIRVIVIEYLKNKGFCVYGAQDGQEGMKIFYDKKPDLIVLDIMLPEKNGWEICKKIKGEADIHVLMLTAKSQDEDDILGLELGADDYMRKPFSMKILLLRIKKLLALNGHSQSNMEF